MAARRAAEPAEREALVEQVLDLVESIPPGRVTTYGLLADLVGYGGPRWVGAVMARYGGAVPWWRVVRADGTLPVSHRRGALSRYRAEATPLRHDPDGVVLGVDMRSASWSPHR